MIVLMDQGHRAPFPEEQVDSHQCQFCPVAPQVDLSGGEYLLHRRRIEPQGIGDCDRNIGPVEDALPGWDDQFDVTVGRFVRHVG